MIEAVGNTLFPYRFTFDGFPDLAGLDLVAAPGKPWLAEIEEPLPVEADQRAHPLCCYIRTVIFYRRPSGPDEIDRCETRLQLDDVLIFDADRWRIMGGSVAWTKGAWHMVWRLRRMHADPPSTGQRGEPEIAG